MKSKFNTRTRLYAAVLGLTVGASAASAQIVVDSSDFNYASTATTTNTIAAFTVSEGDHRKLVLSINYEDADFCTNVTYGGQAFTKAADPGGSRAAQIWYLDDPAVGTADVHAFFEGDARSRMGVLSLQQAKPGVSVADTITGSTNITITTTVSNTFVVGCYTENGGGYGATPFLNTLYVGDGGSCKTHAGYQNEEVAGLKDYAWESFDTSRAIAIAGFESYVYVPPHEAPYEDDYNTLGLWHMGAIRSFKYIDDDDSVYTGRDAPMQLQPLSNAGGVTVVDPGVTAGLDYPAGNSDFGGCAYFTNLSGVIVTDANMPVDITQVCFEGWTKREPTGSGASPMIIDRWGQVNLYITETGYQVQAFTADDGVKGYNVNPAGFSPTNWNHFALEFDDLTVTLKVNGNLEDTITLPSALTANTKGGTYFGKRYGNQAQNDFVGYMDEVRVYNTGPEIETLGEFDAPQAIIAPVIDGSAGGSEWSDAFELPMVWPELGELPNVGSIAYTGNSDGSDTPTTEADATPSDISAAFSFKWDADYLYVLAEITDDILIKPDGVGSGYPDDHFMLGIDPDVTDGDADDSIFLADFFIDSNDVVTNYYRADIDTVDPAMNVFTMAGSEVAGGYVFEMAVSWADLGVVSPVSNDMIGVSMLLIDNDADDGHRDIIMNSIGGDIALPSTYHKVTLTGQATLAPVAFNEWIAGYSVGTQTNMLDDFDLDGMTHLVEYALGGNPETNDVASIMPGSYLDDTGSSNVLAYVYSRRLGYEGLGLSYDVQRDTDLVNTPEGWTSNGVSEVVTGLIGIDFEEVTATVPVDGESIQFMRLQIKQD